MILSQTSRSNMKLAALLLLLAMPAQAVEFEFAIDILECESSGEHRDKHGHLRKGDSGASIGIAQFKRETFELFKKRAGHPEWRHKNAIHQLRLMRWMLDNGHGKHWTCFKGYPPMD